VDIDEYFDIMGNDVRRKILQNLAQGPMSIAKLNELISVSRQAILKHLKDLEERGFVEAREADERDKKTGPNPHVYELKQFFTSQFDPSMNIFNPRVFFLSIGEPEDEEKNETESRQLKNIESIKPLMSSLAELNRKLDELSKTYKDILAERNQTIRELKKMFDSIDLGGEEREVLNYLIEYPERASDGFTFEEIADYLQFRPDFMKFILGNLVEAGILERRKDGRYVPK